MIHDHLKSSGYLNLISGFSKTQPILEIVWSLISQGTNIQTTVGSTEIRFLLIVQKLRLGSSGCQKLVIQ
jgi:hypothetical protein